MKNISNLISASGCFNLDEALRAVAELHTPEGRTEQQCKHDKKSYPCPTMKAIEKELTK